MTKVYLGADHAGFLLKEKIKSYLDNQGIKFVDLSLIHVENDDYPDIAQRLARKVLKEKAKGILVCGSGVGVCMAANKVKGARAVQGYDTYSTKMARQDEDANILCLRSRKFSSRKNKRLVSLFLETPFSNLTRHKRRINKLK